MPVTSQRFAGLWGLALFVAASVVLLAPMSQASDCEKVGRNGLCAEVPGTETPAPTGPASPGGSGGSGGSSCPDAPNGQCQMPGSTCAAEGPCDDVWTWYSVAQCYASTARAVVPGHPVWKEIAGDATDGTVMMCNVTGELFYVAPGQESAPDPRTIALSVVDRAPFVKPDLHTAPSSDIPSVIYVPNWMWVPASQWRDIEAQASVGSTTVTVTGKLVRSEWDMGDGNTHTCSDSGRKWVRGMTAQERTTCSYAYEKTSAYDDGPDSPDGYFTIRGRLVYDVSWTCAGVCTSNGGELGEYSGPSTTRCLTVDQIQTIVVDPKRTRDPAKERRSHCA